MTDEIAIRINRLGRDFGPSFGLGSAREGVTLRGLLRLLGFNVRVAAPDQVQVDSLSLVPALRDVSLTIERGSVVCLDGDSGAGKSTLLRLLAGVIAPTRGSAELHGQLSSLLRIGDNLDRGLSGLENIEEQRQLRKIAEAGSAAFANEVIEFAELTDAAEAPVRTYSSGMALRLSVALALHGNPDILLMDDVLGVGDIAFQQKVSDRLVELKSAGCTMLLALSDDSLVRQLATRLVALDAGQVVADGPPVATLDRERVGLESSISHSDEVAWRIMDRWPENEVAALRQVDVRSAAPHGTSIDFRVQYHLKEAPQRCRPLIDLMAGRMAVFRSVYPAFIEVEKPCDLNLSVRVPTNLVAEGRYRLETSLVSIVGPSIYALKTRDAVTIDIRRTRKLEGTVEPLVLADFPWEIEALSD